ncbi:MAG: ATP-binding protein, partial [Ktedonobacteraceae bacterium]|nr:ATP-binding protein [Ktedonobacteraceae bacterium]
MNTQIQNHEEISHEALQALQYQEERQRLLIHLERDTSHIIGREEECTHLLAFLEQMSSPRKKVVAISAMSGVGKTSVLNLLQKRLLAQEKRSFQIITCESSKQTAQKPQDWFDQILATIYSTLEPKQKEASTVPSLEKRVRRTLQALCASPQPVVIFLDDAQYLIENSAWCVEWKQFLQAFLISDHQATLYIASRAWPAWQERETSSFLFHEDLPTISVEVGIQIWRNLGFAQEREELLRKATEMCGNNPRMMELVAQRIGLPDFSFDWNDESAPQEGLAHFVEHPHQAGIAPLLEEIIGNSLSEPAQQLLTLLALAPVPLPPPVALHVFPGAKHSVQDLVRASLLTKRPDRLRLLPMVAESAIEYTSQADRDAIHEQLTRAYRYWLQAGTFHSEQEQAQVVAALLLLYFQRHQLMEAAELLINAGWLCYHFGHGPRLARVCQEVLTSYDWKQSPQQELAANLLYDRLASFRGEKVTTADRARRYQVLHQNAQEAGIMLA